MRYSILPMVVIFAALSFNIVYAADCLEQCSEFTGEGMGAEYQSCMQKCTGAECPEGMAYIPPGSFMMGSSEKDIERILSLCEDCEPEEFVGETPQRHVTISKGFCMDKYEVTQGQYDNLMGNNPSRFTECGVDCPVEMVAWYDANAYCQKAGKQLPTEAQWEYAARSGTTTDFYIGNITDNECDNPVLDRVAWYCGNSGDSTHEVGGKEPNAYGLYDMLGNVWEWTEDCYDEHLYAEMPATNPENICKGDELRVIRGGSWYSRGATIVRVSLRSHDYDGYYDFGFRCSQDLN